MRTVGREITYNTHSRENVPSATVADGEIFRVKTELNGGGWLQSMDDHWRPDKSRGPNLCVCVAVEGAHPGDALAVDIMDLAPEGIGYTGFAGWRNLLSQKIYPNDWDVVEKTVAISGGEILWSDALRLPVSPMLGTLGAAPAGEPVSNYFAAKNGGNMDVQELCKGATLYLPVAVEGALLHIGDMHAIMGDGEINHGGGIECRGEATLRARVIPGGAREGWLRLENEDYIIAVACLPDMQDAFHAAAHELIDWMCGSYGFDAREAFLLLGQAMQARCTLALGEADYPKTYICKIAKRYLKPDAAFVAAR